MAQPLSAGRHTTLAQFLKFAIAVALLSGCTQTNVPLSVSTSNGLRANSDYSRPVATYSIVARDAKTGEMGVAVQSHWFSVGPIVPWAEAGVGAVATQSLVKVSYGPDGLNLMRSGASSESALAKLLEADEARDVRQVAMIDSKGNFATHSGSRCIAEAGFEHGTAPDGSTYSAQANLMRGPGVPEAMADAFEAAPAGMTLAERLLACLHAAERAGGDVRGRQSAAIIVVRAVASGNSWEDRVVDLRVEDHSAPVDELDRLLTLHRAYQQMNEGDLAMEKQDVEGALKAYSTARALAPGNAEMIFWTAVSLVNAGKIEEAIPLFREAFKDEKGDWKTTLERLPAAGLFPTDPALMKRILD